MENPVPPRDLEYDLMAILRVESPMALNVLLDRLDVSQFDTRTRELIWQLIDQGKIKLTDDRKLEFLADS